MKDSPSKRLRKAVKELLIPYIYSRGFQDDTRGISKSANLFNAFVRWNGNTLELLNVQYDKHGRAKFVLNFGVVPPEGVEYCGYHYGQQDAIVGGLPQQARLYYRRPWCWFGFPLIRIPLLRNPSAEDIANRAIRLFPQIEAWLKDGVKGPNIGVMSTPGKNQKPPP